LTNSGLPNRVEIVGYYLPWSKQISF
jgi:hypothetical protein